MIPASLDDEASPQQAIVWEKWFCSSTDCLRLTIDSSKNGSCFSTESQKAPGSVPHVFVDGIRSMAFEIILTCV